MKSANSLIPNTQTELNSDDSFVKTRCTDSHLWKRGPRTRNAMKIGMRAEDRKD